VKKHKEIGFDFEIYKLTNSSENVVTGDSLATEMPYILDSDLNTASKRADGYLTGDLARFVSPSEMLT